MPNGSLENLSTTCTFVIISHVLALLLGCRPPKPPTMPDPHSSGQIGTVSPFANHPDLGFANASPAQRFELDRIIRSAQRGGGGAS